MVNNILDKFHFKTNPIRRLYNKIIKQKQKVQKKRNLAKKHQRMEKYGPEALSILYSIFKKNNIYIWFEYGTLLGAYREKGFIPYDDDIDLGMFYEDYTPNLQRELFNEGFLIKHYFYKIYNLDPSNRIMSEITLLYKNIQIDIFFSFKNNEYREYSFCSEYISIDKNILRNQYTKVPLEKFDEIDFLGIKFWIPSNTKECLTTIYGENFMTPIKNWVDTSNKKIEPPYEKEYCEMIGTW